MNAINLLEKFAGLPDVLIYKIINYTDVISYRNGKYINKINKKDKRYDILKNITRPIYVCKNKIVLRLIDYNNCGYFIEYKIKSDIIIINIRFFYREIDGFDVYFNIKTNNTYILTPLDIYTLEGFVNL